MKRAATVFFAANLLLAAEGAAWAQIVAPATPAKSMTVPGQVVTPADAKPVAVMAPAATIASRESRGQRIPLAVIDYLNKTFDGKLQAQNPNDPIDLLGTTRGTYLTGYGAVFTTELSPIVTPGLSPFNTKITDQQRDQVHQRKLARMETLRRLMLGMMKDSATSLNLMPEDQMVVVAVRLLYLPWENTAGLPNLILMKADRRTVLTNGQVQTEEQ